MPPLGYPHGNAESTGHNIAAVHIHQKLLTRNNKALLLKTVKIILNKFFNP